MGQSLALHRVGEVSCPTGVKPKSGMTGSKLTTYGIGGALANFVEIDNEEALIQFIKILNQRGEPFRVIGAGSNLLIDDHGLNDWVIKLGRGLRYCNELSAGRFEVGAAMPLITLSHELSNRGYSGLEFAGGIPASVGGATYMNAGAHHGSMSDIIKEVALVTSDGEYMRLTAAEIKFGYRRSHLPLNSIVTKIWIELSSGDRAEILDRRAQYLSQRKRAQPITLPSSGSVFKNPSGDKGAGILIAEAGLKGLTIGGAQVSEKHGNWIVNETRSARAVDVLQIIELCEKTVKEKFNIELERELIVWRENTLHG